MLRLHFPELLLLAIPLGFVFLRWGRAHGTTGVLRFLFLVVLLLAVAGLEWNLSGKGIDVVVVADRSRSMPVGSEARMLELIGSLQERRQAGDRIGLVTFGAKALRESILSSVDKTSTFTQQILPDGSDLNAGIHAALDLLSDRNRPARIFVLSDGESNGSSPRSAARRARELQIPIDYRPFPRPRVGDVSIESIDLPETVSPREPFQYTVWINSTGVAEGKVTVLRDGQVIASDSAPRRFEPGQNRVLFRDILEQGGLHAYEVRAQVENDPLEQNNRGDGVIRVVEGPRVLVLNADGKEDNLSRAIRAGQVPVDVAAAARFPLSAVSLDRYRTVILENVPANDLGRLKMEGLAQFVEDRGGGLLMTGGERSFGNGGYYRSPIEEVLPVSLEMREEHRKTRVAVAIALDRSGSMTAPVGGGKVKMDLADLGTAECVRMLSPGDSVAVIAVDSSAHVIQPLVDVTDPESIARRALKIQSEGGGIFVYEALVAAGRELTKATQGTKHVILFADAADAEQPGDYINLLRKFEANGITVSVIGLGKKTDSDAAFLEDVAKRGHGTITFSDDPKELPRLFAQETMNIARSSFIKKEPKTQPTGIPGINLPGMRLITEAFSESFPHVDGYNLTYLKNSATQGTMTEDEYKAPLSAFWYRGLGRVAVLTTEADGKHSGEFGNWKSYADFLLSHVRWLLGDGVPDNVFVSVSREGQVAVVNVEFDPDRPVQNAQAPTLQLVGPGEERENLPPIPFVWQGAHQMQAKFRLSAPGVYLPLVRFGEKSFVRAAAVSLPYSPEFSPRTGLPGGEEILRTLSELTGGKPRLDVSEVLIDRPRSAQMLPLHPYLFWLAILLLILEIAGRRLSLWTPLEQQALALLRRARGKIAAVRPATTETSSMPSTTLPADRPKKPRSPAPATAPPRPARAPAQTTQPTAIPSPPQQTAPPAEQPNVFDLAKRRARRRME